MRKSLILKLKLIVISNTTLLYKRDSRLKKYKKWEMIILLILQIFVRGRLHSVPRG
jgi:hypothetical protein